MKGPSLRTLLIGANGLALMLPIIAVVSLRIYDTYLVRQTERSLIAQSVVIGEIFREKLVEEQGGDVEGQVRPPSRVNETFVPIEPVLDFSFRIERVAPPQSLSQSRAPVDTPAHRAGARMEGLLKRAQIFNLTGVRILDTEGCVVSTSRSETDACMADFAEVQAALEGHYAAVARERVSDEPTPSLNDVRSRGTIRIFSALPVFHDGKVIGVVRASRTSMDALTSLWRARRGLVMMIGIVIVMTLGVSAMFAAMVVRPVRALTNDAIAITNDAERTPLRMHAWTPHELRVLSQALDTMTTTLRERADYIAAFAANVSHELKTPITAIRGAAELLSDAWPTMSEEQRARFIRNIDLDAERMERLVTRLLHLARIENAGDPSGSTHVRDVLLGLTAGRAESVIEESVPTTWPVSEDVFVSAVGNLVDNAARHGTRVHVTCAVRSGKLAIEVRDNGPGISAANQSRVFERFFTTERERGGTGLGLNIVRAIARRRGGDVTFATSPAGTTFTVSL